MKNIKRILLIFAAILVGLIAVTLYGARLFGSKTASSIALFVLSVCAIGLAIVMYLLSPKKRRV